MITVPARLLTLPEINVIFQDDNYHVLEKLLTKPQYDRESYLSTHALSIVLSGRQRITDENDRSHDITKGHAATLRRGLYTVTDLLPDDGGAFRAVLIYFTKFTSGRLSAPEEIRTPIFPWEWTSPRLDNPARISSYLDTVPNKEHLNAAPYRRDVLSFMEEHFDKPLTLDDFAYLSGMSVSTFQRRFREETGESPRNWIIHRRMETARGLLRRPEANVAQVAAAVGYRNTSHFITRYRAAYGHTPLTEYRHFRTQGG